MCDIIEINSILESILNKVCVNQSIVEKDIKCELNYNNNNKCKRRVGYVFSRQLLIDCNRLPKVKGRAFLVHELIKAYGLTKKCLLIESIAANESQLRSFHTEDYLNFMKHISKELLTQTEDDMCEELTNDEFGIGYDCPPIAQLYELISQISGSSICAANAIITKKCEIAINWFGGWHHSHKDEASGYCYTNDIVFAVLHLLQNGFTKVLYIDLDLHHSDGVENAFAHTNKVLTLSFHKYETGFFPGTGDTTDVGFGSKGKYYSVNIPLKDGINDENYVNIFVKVLNKINSCYNSEVIICQCGADGLIGDPMNSFNLTIDGYYKCVQHIISFNKPLILLGGGGYHLLNTARLWTALTACALNEELNNDIPDHSFFLSYRPTYELHIEAGLRPDFNSKQYIEHILKKVFHNLDFIK